ncbi:UbiX family flavin prenyltransferase [Candidatus Lucifugimonas marina]|jgi:4-hydroxy-3-polyprenylbenzoate decarboxylase|uniref:Flavin prenyltransferase UbiX n=1 Tax=Candidatus Lucifugimonas marina TaxID=3038979 RepID=A0AAJ5ZDB3_9CHLR|nr:UbiX family flavin prenyltransferase [SAR202 cluster bacterium JH702]MDG0868717.1 UbiX family flavin prenyltransferase [SAR202 cluster bacterium JH639]WFG35349.1 UbiX family flavin prenyltransferase [SAR202 cluster bacterium JH545]WFG39297.1 UbiX family flavin prenyltransferase [SAR202 cluster bacterium JH1073]
MGIYVLGIAGASGAPYARRVLEQMLLTGHDVKAVITDAGRKVLEVEEDLVLTGNTEADTPAVLAWAQVNNYSGTFELYHHKDVASPIASGSFLIDGMAVVPCSGGTLGRIAHGISNGLLERAADVCIKERRRLVLVPREMPVSLIHLRNMTAVTEAGAIVLPASPGFYHKPTEISELIDMVAGRILASLGIESTVMKPWLGPEPSTYSEEGIQ